MCATVMKMLKDSARTADAGDEDSDRAPGVGPEVEGGAGEVGLEAVKVDPIRTQVECLLRSTMPPICRRIWGV
jgi:hypothetical protein